MIHRILSAACLALACTALPAAAQQSFGPSLEASLGPSVGMGGSFADRGGGGIDGVLAVPVARTSTGTVMLGVTGAINGKMARDLSCVTGPDAECIPEFPTFASLGMLGGVQRTLGAGFSARALAGPTYYQAVDGDDTFGVQGRVDVAKRIVFHLSLVASARAAVLPSYEDQALTFASFGIGFRIQ